MRRWLREPINEIYDAASLLSDAVDAHLVGNRDLADELILRADMPVIGEWTESIWGKRNPEIHRSIAQAAPLPFLGPELRPKPRMPDSIVQKEVVLRDGFHCRFCGIPVVPPSVRQTLVRLYPKSVRWGRRNSEQHAALQCVWLQFDHLVPNQRGGASVLDNLIITCAPCNFGRMEQTIEEAGLANPLLRSPEPSWQRFHSWNGLTQLL